MPRPRASVIDYASAARRLPPTSPGGATLMLLALFAVRDLLSSPSRRRVRRDNKVGPRRANDRPRGTEGVHLQRASTVPAPAATVPSRCSLALGASDQRSTTMGTHTITVPPQTGPMPARHEVVDPLCGVLLDAAEGLHKSSSDEAWTATPCTQQERENLLLATRYVTQMMGAFGLWDLSNPSGEGAPAGKSA